MPRTKLAQKYAPPDYSGFTREIKSQLVRMGLTFKEITGGRNPESFRRWVHGPNRIRMEDLATLLQECKYTPDEQDRIVLNLYHLCARR